ncbi:MAG: hypothetical protein Q9225_003492 [Loekoesia sp. 1 TL-2023]
MPRQSGKNARPFSETYFGKLPAELRDEIYRWALTMPSDSRSEAFPWVYLQHKYPAGFRKDGLLWYTPTWRIYRTRPQRWLGLLQSCRQVYGEAVHIFYMVNQIAFDSASGLVRFSKTFPDRFMHLTTIYIDHTEKHPLELMKALAKCTNLRHLSIGLVAAYWRPDTVWLSRCRTPEVKKAIREVRGLERVEFSEQMMKEWHQCRHAGCPRYACPNDWFDWTPKRIKIAEKIRQLMLRPKMTSDESHEPGESSETMKCKIEVVDLTQEDKDSHGENGECGTCSGTLKRKREIIDLTEGDDSDHQEDEGCDDSEEEEEDTEEDDDSEEENEYASDDGEHDGKRIRLDA